MVHARSGKQCEPLHTWPSAASLFPVVRQLGSIAAVAVSALVATMGIPRQVAAEEPVKRFLARLQDEGMYDIGLKYLDSLTAKGKLPESLKEDLPLERNLLLQESLRSVRTPQQRDDRMALIEKGYKDFLSTAPSHPRRSEAQTKLGDLLLERSQIALTESKKEENKGTIESFRTKARQGYLEALDLYSKIIEELKPILESMKGDKIKANDTDGKSRREKYQAEYRQAQILQAKMMEFVSQTYDVDSPDWKQWLAKAETALTQVIDKTSSTEAARRMLSLLYRGEIQRKLSKFEEARDSYAYVADQDGTGIFRTWKAQATAGILRLEIAGKSPKYEAVIQRGDETLKQASANDKNEPEWIDLQLAVAEARLAWLKLLDERKDENKFRNNRKAARELFQAIVKKQASRNVSIQESVRKAKDGLSQLGIETVEKGNDSLPETKTFTDAIKAGRERLDRAESEEPNISILEQKLADAQDKSTFDEQIRVAKESVHRDRLQATVLYQRAIQLYRDKDARDDLLETRYLMCYLFLRTEQYWECAAIAQDLLVSASGTERAEKSAGFGILSLNKLMLEAATENQIAFAAPLERIAKKLAQSAPDSAAAQDAVELLIKLALIHKQYDKAESYVAMGQGKGGAGSSILGQILWGEYRRNASQHRLNKTVETAEDLSLKQRAEKLLVASWDSLDPSRADKNIISGANALASLYLSSNRTNEALAVLSDPGKGAVRLSESRPGLDSTIKLETLRIQLQAMVQAAGQGKKELDATDVSAIVRKMKVLTANNEELLTNSLRNLAYELPTQLELTTDMEMQARLGSAFGVLVKQIVQVSSDIGTLDSAGTAVLVLASKLQKIPSLAPQAKPLMAIAEEAFSKLAAKSSEELSAAKLDSEKFQYKLGLAKSEAGKHEEAHSIFANWLSKSPGSLTIQMEAARNLEKWSEGNKVDLLKKALFGTEPNAKKTNQVWGWAQISNTTSRQINQHKDAYFESRLSIARCRRQIALTETADQRKQTLEKAMSDIRHTYLLTPELGGPESEAKFSKLLKEIQQHLGRPPIGIEEFKQRVANQKN
ncbi:MAG: hypothetical protein ABL921_11675 [Pirellula sp.]